MFSVLWFPPQPQLCISTLPTCGVGLVVIGQAGFHFQAAADLYFCLQQPEKDTDRNDKAAEVAVL